MCKTLTSGVNKLSLERNEMIKSLNEIVFPALKERGFKGEFPTFYRKWKERTDLLMFQLDWQSKVLSVEISKCPSRDYLDSTGKRIPPDKLKVSHIGVNRTGIGEGTFQFDNTNTREVSRKVLYSFKEAEEWWDTHPNWWIS